MSDSYNNTNTRAETLNQAAAHDTGIYDPNIHDNQIVAMYETEARARAARDALVSNGVPERAISITSGEQGRLAGGVDYERSDSGLWGSIKRLFMPDEEAHGYAEGVRRGHAILVVQPDATMDRHRIVELLESTDPVDFDAKLEEWRQAGYSYPGATGAGMAAAGAVGAATGTPTVADLPGGNYETRSVSGMSGAQAGTTATPAASRPPLADVQGTRAATGATATGQDETIKVIEERLQVGKREVVKGAVRVHSYVVERPVEQQVRLHEERVEVERRPVDRPVNVADDALFRERVIEARATGEEAIIGKEARVVEEVGLHKEATNRTETVRDTVRKTEVEVEGEPSAAGRIRDAARPAGATPTAGAASSRADTPRK